MCVRLDNIQTDRQTDRNFVSINIALDMLAYADAVHNKYSFAKRIPHLRIASNGKKNPLPHLLPCQLWSFQVKQYERNSGDPPEKVDPSRPTFQGHSTSLEPTRIDRLPMTSC